MTTFPFHVLLTEKSDLGNLYESCKANRAVKFDLVSGNETPENAIEGYCGAYSTYFEECGILFPIPEPLLEILAKLSLVFSYMCPNFLRHFLTLSVRARKENFCSVLRSFVKFDW